MWQIVPDPVYVANPSKGSIHNRGGAVDISLIGPDGNELNMGTGFDHFGPEAAHDFQDLPDAVTENRKLLRQVMEQNGFESLRSEWWHYNLKGASAFKLANFHWPCGH